MGSPHAWSSVPPNWGNSWVSGLLPSILSQYVLFFKVWCSRPFSEIYIYIWLRSESWSTRFKYNNWRRLLGWNHFSFKETTHLDFSRIQDFKPEKISQNFTMCLGLYGIQPFHLTCTSQTPRPYGTDVCSSNLTPNCHISLPYIMKFVINAKHQRSQSTPSHCAMCQHVGATLRSRARKKWYVS